MYSRSFFYILILALVFELTSCKSKQKSIEPSSNQQSSSSKGKKTQKKKQSETLAKTKTVKPDLQNILGVSSKEIKKNDLYRFVEDWYGVPYKYGGCKKSGVDCSCFTNILYEQVYKQKLIGNAAELYKNADKISLHKAKEGDLVFFKINVPYISHVGILLRDEHFVHASSSKGVIVSSLNEAYYKKYFHSAGRIKAND